ncbi:MAG TPA: hypothetical protein ENH11_04870, partial [Candidatus Acetothermia bacterium]|nr:hypothetical protein [Candidatus Acetothermia bacterium]
MICTTACALASSAGTDRCGYTPRSSPSPRRSCATHPARRRSKWGNRRRRTLSIIDGRAIARKYQEILRHAVAVLANDAVIPAIAPILVGEDSAARVYYRAKARLAEKLGIRFCEIKLPEGTREEDVIDAVNGL